ncbi:MAG: PIN domain-containing protein [Bacteroidales bacterium]|jgi:predicted nucleic acid-binding protein|nr:PIN domain-containing protein [Bacteroidales bacterium]
MKILIDTNITLDILLKREPFCREAERIIGLTQGGVGVFLSASSVTDVYYIARETLGDKGSAMALLESLLCTVGVASVSGGEIHRAIALDWNDFEDAVQYAVGESLNVDYVVTRNRDDFTSDHLPVVTPEELIGLLSGD